MKHLTLQFLLSAYVLINISLTVLAALIDDQLAFEQHEAFDNFINPNDNDELAALEVDQNGNNGEEYHGHEEIYLLEDKDYPWSLYERYPGVGQVSGITTLPSNDVAIFHRAGRQWDEQTFNQSNFTVTNYQNASENLIRENTIMILDRENGSSLIEFGANLFYMPHSIASDSNGNLWVSDVARHQVMRLPTGRLQRAELADDDDVDGKRWIKQSNLKLWPDVILGEAFVPGQDEKHFCQPSEMVVSSDNRLLFVADGYCNQRVMVFTTEGKLIASFGEDSNMNVVHSLTLIEDRNLLCVSDREQGRILCFKAGIDNNLSSLGELVLDLKYPLGKVFAIAAMTPSHLLVSSKQYLLNKYDLAALNPFTKEIKQIWSSSDLLVPHSLATTRDGRYAYAADVSKEAFKKVFKFDIIQRIV